MSLKLWAGHEEAHRRTDSQTDGHESHNNTSDGRTKRGEFCFSEILRIAESPLYYKTCIPYLLVLSIPKICKTVIFEGIGNGHHS